MIKIELYIRQNYINKITNVVEAEGKVKVEDVNN